MGGLSSPSESPMGGGESTPPPGGEAEVTPESIKRENLNILLENDDMMSENSFIDLSRGRDNLGDISIELDKLLNKRYL